MKCVEPRLRLGQRFGLDSARNIGKSCGKEIDLEIGQDNVNRYGERPLRSV